MKTWRKYVKSLISEPGMTLKKQVYKKLIENKGGNRFVYADGTAFVHKVIFVVKFNPPKSWYVGSRKKD